MIPQTTIPVDGGEARQVLALIEALEETRRRAGRLRELRHPRSHGRWLIRAVAGDCPRPTAAPRLNEQMFDSCVLGVDPGLARLGLAVVARRDRRPASCGRTRFETPRRPAGSRSAADDRDAVRERDRRARARIASRSSGWRGTVTTPRAMAVARATGVVMLVAAEAGLAVEEYGPLEVKMAITGAGSADKAQVRRARPGRTGSPTCRRSRTRPMPSPSRVTSPSARPSPSAAARAGAR